MIGYSSEERKWPDLSGMSGLPPGADRYPNPAKSCKARIKHMRQWR
jgi:hypothetical protein